MGRTLRWASTEVIPDIDAVKSGEGSAPAGWSLVTSPSPPHGTRWIKKTGVAANHIGLGESAVIYTPGAREYACQRGLIITGTLGSGDTIGILWGHTAGGGSGAYSLNALGQADGSFKLEVDLFADGKATSSSTFAVGIGNIHNFRISFDGTNVTLEVNGSSEATQTSAAKPDTERGTLLKEGKAGIAVYWNRVAGWSADGGSDRPGVAIEQDRLDPNGAGTDADFGDQIDCIAGTPHWNLWDDWATGPDDGNTTYNCGRPSEQQTSDVTTHTPTDNIEGVVLVCMMGPSAGSKNVDSDLRIHDGTNFIDKNLPNMDAAFWFSQQRTFPLAPDGGAWTQGDVDGLEVGVDHIGGTTNLKCTAICGILVSVDDDPEAAPATNRRRVGAQVA